MTTATLSPVPPGFVRFKDKLIHAVRIPGITPSGLHIALLHGIAATASSWLPLMRYLIPIAREFIVVDLPGHGLSPAPNPPFSCFDAYECAEYSLLQLLDPDSNNLVIGNSLGGAFALKFALDNPDFVSKCVLISPAGTPFPNSAREVIEPFYKDTLVDAIHIIEKIWVHPTIKARLLAPAIHHTMIQPSFKSLMESIMDIDDHPDSPLAKLIFTQEKLQSFRTPTLFIWGQNDHILPHPMRDAFDAALPDSTTRLFPREYGHCPQFEHPESLARHICDWLDS